MLLAVAIGTRPEMVSTRAVANLVAVNPREQHGSPNANWEL